MVNILAALGRAQLKKLPQTLATKKNIFIKYETAFTELGIKIYSENQSLSNYWLVNILLDSPLERDRVLQKLSEDNIQARPLWTPIHRQPAFHRFQRAPNRFPNADDLWNKCVSLPSSPSLSDSDLERVVGSVRQSLKGRIR